MSSGKLLDWLRKNWSYIILIIGLLVVWSALHLFIVVYGTHDVPLNRAYVGDEQAPLSGALHIAEERSPFAMRGHDAVYYGPVFSALVLPSVLIDYASRLHAGLIKNATDYKYAYTLNWGPALYKARWVSVLFGFLGLLGIWWLCGQRAINPDGNVYLRVLAVSLIGSNFFYFLYSGWLRHWIYVTVSLVFQVYFLVRIKDDGRWRYWIGMLAAVLLGFGISYFPLLYQIVWLPVIVIWWKGKGIKQLKRFGLYVFVMLVGCGLVFWINPDPFFRLWRFSGETQYHLNPLTLPSLGYYLKVIIFDQPFLTASSIPLAIIFWRQRLHKKYWIWSIGLVGLVHLLFFSLSIHAEPRYVLPSVVCLAMATLCILGATDRRTQAIKHYLRFVLVLLALEICFQTVTDVRWSWLSATGPEEKALVSWLQTIPDDKRVLIDSGPFLGAMHRNYADIIQACYPKPADLQRYLADLKLPSGGSAIKVDYLCNRQGTYDYQVNKVGYELADNYFFEEKTTRLWFSDELREKFEVTGRYGSSFYLKP